MQYRKIVPIKGGRTCLLRSATEADGEEVYRFFHLTHGQTENLLSYPEENSFTPEEERGFLGISGTDVSEDAMEQYDMPEGVFVSKVLEDTPAQKAGILKGDIIISIDGEKVTQMKGVQNLLEYYAAGTEIEVTFMRQSKGEYKEMTVDVTLGLKDE